MSSFTDGIVFYVPLLVLAKFINGHYESNTHLFNEQTEPALVAIDSVSSTLVLDADQSVTSEVGLETTCPISHRSISDLSTLDSLNFSNDTDVGSSPSLLFPMSASPPVVPSSTIAKGTNTTIESQTFGLNCVRERLSRLLLTKSELAAPVAQKEPLCYH